MKRRLITACCEQDARYTPGFFPPKISRFSPGSNAWPRAWQADALQLRHGAILGTWLFSY